MVSALTAIFSGLNVTPPCVMSLSQGSVLSHEKGSDGFGRLKWSSSHTCQLRVNYKEAGLMQTQFAG